WPDPAIHRLSGGVCHAEPSQGELCHRACYCASCSAAHRKQQVKGMARPSEPNANASSGISNKNPRKDSQNDAAPKVMQKASCCDVARTSVCERSKFPHPKSCYFHCAMKSGFT